MGVFVGATPLYGLHLPLVLAIAVRLRLDAIVAYAAANVSNPLVSPFLVAFELHVGAQLLSRPGPFAATERDLASALAHGPLELALGAVVVGAGLAVVVGPLVALGVATKRTLFGTGAAPRYALPSGAPAWVRAAERVAERYAVGLEADAGVNAYAATRAHFHYVRIKLATDPVAQLVASSAGEREGALGEVLDLGAGRGQLAIALVELRRAKRVVGVDWDGAKVEAGRRAIAAGPTLPIELVERDVRLFETDATFDTVLLIDVLHYLALDEQDALLERAARAVASGGRIVVREADTERGLRSVLTRLEERVFTALGVNRGERVELRSARSIADRLSSHGLSARVLPAWGRTPFSNVAIVAERPA